MRQTIFNSGLENCLYIFGGSWDTWWGTDSAVKYDGIIWSEVGKMLSGRHGHRSLVSKNTIYHIGGDYDKYSNT